LDADAELLSEMTMLSSPMINAEPAHTHIKFEKGWANVNGLPHDVKFIAGFGWVLI
jgi:hypothetical protein